MKPFIIAWSEDLALATRQAAYYRYIHWLRPLAAMLGNEAAASAIRTAETLRRTSTDQVRLVFPHVLEKVDHRSALLVWRPSFMDPRPRAPRQHDDTFAPTRFRETQGEEGLMYLEKVLEPNENPGLTIQARQLWQCVFLEKWITQKAASASTPRVIS